MSEVVQSELRSLLGDPRAVDRRTFVVTSLGAGFAAAVLPVSAQTITTPAAVADAVAGVGAVFGAAGAGRVAAVVFLLGNPLSGLASAPEMLPQPCGEIGQWLPPGAGGTLLRSVAFFDGAAATPHVLVLAGWALVAPVPASSETPASMGIRGFIVVRASSTPSHSRCERNSASAPCAPGSQAHRASSRRVAAWAFNRTHTQSTRWTSPGSTRPPHWRASPVDPTA